MSQHTLDSPSNDMESRDEEHSSDQEPAEVRHRYIPATKRPLHPAETGLFHAVNLAAEGDDDDETQDAALDSGETSSDHRADTQTEAQPQDTPEPAPGQPKVLIIEDTMELAEVIQATLERLDIKTVHETHGDKAMKAFIDLDPSVVLLDISLPDISGWKIMDMIKERLEQTKGQMPKVIIITAYDDPANRLIGKLQGVHDYLIKPFTSDEIEQLVRQALGLTSSS